MRNVIFIYEAERLNYKNNTIKLEIFLNNTQNQQKTEPNKNYTLKDSFELLINDKLLPLALRFVNTFE